MEFSKVKFVLKSTVPVHVELVEISDLGCQGRETSASSRTPVLLQQLVQLPPLDAAEAQGLLGWTRVQLRQQLRQHRLLLLLFMGSVHLGPPFPGPLQQRFGMLSTVLAVGRALCRGPVLDRAAGIQDHTLYMDTGDYIQDT